MSERRLHQRWEVPIPVALRAEIADAGPREVIRDEWNALPREHLEHAQTAADGLLAIGIIGKLQAWALHHQDVMVGNVADVADHLSLRGDHVDGEPDGVDVLRLDPGRLEIAG